MDRPYLDYAGLFDASPNPYLVLDRALNIVGANRAYLDATGRELDDIVGCWAWDAFPTDPETLRQSVASFQRVLQTGKPDTMALLRFDIPRPEAEGGGFEERYWSIVHTPVLDEHGDVALVLQHPIDVTELQRLRDAARYMGPERRVQPTPAQSGIFSRAHAVQEANRWLQAEGDRLRRLFEQAPGFMCALHGPEHRFELANAAYVQLVGNRDLVGMPVREALPELKGQGFYELLDRVYATGETFVGRRVEIAVQPGLGAAPETRFVDFVYQPITDGDGRVSGIFVEGNDVTEAKRASDALRAERDRSRGILESMAEGFVLLDRDWRVVEVNAEGARLDGRPREALLGRTHWELWPASAGTEVEAAYRRAMDQRIPAAFEHRYVGEGHDRWLELRAYPSDDGLAVFYRDISDRKRAEAALRESEARFRGFVETSTDVLWIIDAEVARLEYLSPSYERVWGEARERVVQDLDHWAETVHPSDRARVVGSLVRALAGETCTVEYRIVRPDGAVRWILDTGFSIPDENGRTRRVGGIAQDITERKRAETALRESEARFRHMADSAPALIWMTDARGHVTFANMHHEHLFGRPAADLLGEGWAEIVLPEDLERHTAAFFTAFHARAPFVTETRVRDKGGQVRWLRCDGVPRLDDAGAFLGYTGCNVDITEARLAADALEVRVAERTAELRHALGQLHEEVVERAQAEEALRQAQKMEAVGQLTGGIAHDFNNMLQGIGGAVELARRRVEQGRTPDVLPLMDAARQGVTRAAALTHRLLAFASRQALDAKPVVLDGLVLGMADLIGRAVGPAIEVRTRMGDGDWPMLCDANGLENALLNLAINARDAMPQGGTLTLATRDVRLSAVDVAGQDGAAPGDYVELCVSDTGVGMTPDVMARAFEPFFTTKPIGQGTGLGLSQLYGFVRQSGGVVRLDSAPGRGTTVRLYLPRHHGSEPTATAVGDTTQTETHATAGATVLLAEDEVGVRELAAEVLRELGYTVLEAGDGPAALRLLRTSARVDVLVTDVGLPGGMNGRQVADAARERRPGLPVLFITGYAGSVLDGQLAPGMEVIGKPFTLEALAARVRAMLEAAFVK